MFWVKQVQSGGKNCVFHQKRDNFWNIINDKELLSLQNLRVSIFMLISIIRNHIIWRYRVPGLQIDLKPGVKLAFLQEIPSFYMINMSAFKFMRFLETNWVSLTLSIMFIFVLRCSDPLKLTKDGGKMGNMHQKSRFV